MTRCNQDTRKAPLFPKQNSTTMLLREVLHSLLDTGGGDYQEPFTTLNTTQLTTNCSKRYVWEEAKGDENSGESFADPLYQSHGADDAQKAKDHSFFRLPLGEGNVFQIVPESKAQLLPLEDVRSFLSLKDRNLDVAEQVTSAIGIHWT
jgi:hypothetical protein